MALFQSLDARFARLVRLLEKDTLSRLQDVRPFQVRPQAPGQPGVLTPAAASAPGSPAAAAPHEPPVTA